MAFSRKGLIEAWRIVPKGAQYDPFSGKGAEKVGGRWNHKGTSMVYCSSSISLGMLEILANLRGIRSSFQYLAYWIMIPENACLMLDKNSIKSVLERNQLQLTRDIGSYWAQAQQSLTLKVPSILNPYESNFLINPLHPDFETTIKVAAKNEAKIIELDPRFIQHIKDKDSYQ